MIRFLIFIVLLGALAYYVYTEEDPAQPSPETESVEMMEPEAGVFEEHILAPMNRAEDFKDNTYNEALDKHREEMDKQQ